ncbi:MAG: hypothetical protein EAZ91_07565 [Cytophagales bacterium]|nr:MAG: hypothetical protein EAZ91_07565 [Cytophagales bacterium]
MTLCVPTLLALLLTFCLPTLAQTPPPPPAEKLKFGPLFKHETVLNISLNTNIKAVLRDRGNSPVDHWAVLTYGRKKKKPLALPVKVRVRGHFRKGHCAFPPLLLDIDKRKKKNSVFAYQNRLKLVTHCSSGDYIEREYLVYKLYNLLTDYSFRVRPVRVTYEDSAGTRKPEIQNAFLIEDEGDMAKRNKAKPFKLKQVSMTRVDSMQMATVSVFEFMIGNTDWSVPFMHNVKLLARNEEGPPVPVPYDFDHSGIVSAHYAHPPEILELSSVRERLYRGLQYSPETFQKVFDRFRQVKPQMYALYTTNTTLSSKYIKTTINYLDDFYAIIDDPKSLKRVFIYGGGKKINAVIKGL